MGDLYFSNYIFRGIIIVFIYASSIDSVFKLIIKLQKVLCLLFLLSAVFYRNLTLDLEIAFIGADYLHSFKLDLTYFIGKRHRVPNLSGIGVDVHSVNSKLGRSIPNLPMSTDERFLFNIHAWRRV